MFDDVASARHAARGGRAAALALLDRIRPSAYARSRNFLDGAVTRLSPYLRHGILTLAEVRDAALRRAPATPIEKFVQELAWREYYVRAYEVLGDRIWDDIEPYKTGRTAAQYGDELPQDVAEARTGLACMDTFVRELRDTGYLHNHARMWFASYLVHVRGIRWQAGAGFFLRLLLDGDPASNNLSWQWVASTFSHKPYIFNRENLERYTHGVYCAKCPVRERGCPFAAPYGELDDRLFPDGQRAVETFERPDLHVRADAAPSGADVPPGAVVWQHEESLSPLDPARAAAPGAAAIFVWDSRARERDPWSPLRVRFVEETLAELGLSEIARGDAAEEIVRFARERGASAVVMTAAADPRLRAVARGIAERMPAIVLPAPRLAKLDRETDLTRYSRYWGKAKKHAGLG